MDAKTLKKLMEKKRLTPKTLGDKVGVTDRTVEGWLQGRKPSTMAKKLLAMV